MNWWNLLKFYAADDDWEHFDPDVHDPLDFLAGQLGPHHSPHEQPEVVEGATEGDTIEDKLFTEDESHGQGGAGPPRGPGEDRPARGQTTVVPNRPRNMPMYRRGTGSEPSRGYVRPRNTPLPPPRENTNREQFNYSRVPRRILMPGEERQQTRRWLEPPVPPTSHEPEDTSAHDEAIDRAIELLTSGQYPTDEDAEMDRHPGSLMTESDLADKYHGSPIHLDNSDEFANVADLLEEGGPVHDVAGVMSSGDRYPVEFQDVGAELQDDPDAPTPPWAIDAMEEAIRTGKATPEDVEMFINPEHPDRPTTRAGIGLDPMTAMELGLPPFGTGDDTPSAERRVHIDREPQVHEIMDTIEDHPDDFDMERIMEGPRLGPEHDIAEPTFTGIPWNEDTGFTMGEPMTPFNAAWTLLKFNTGAAHGQTSAADDDLSNPTIHWDDPSMNRLREQDYNDYMDELYQRKIAGDPECEAIWDWYVRNHPDMTNEIEETYSVPGMEPGAPEEGGVTRRIPSNQVGVTTSPSANLEAQANHHGFSFDEQGNLVITSSDKKEEPEEEKTSSVLDLLDE
tara:strand:- start:7933 stop:9630 length:1698 start_codon:yes stop_codon:yes gene_type:complete